MVQGQPWSKDRFESMTQIWRQRPFEQIFVRLLVSSRLRAATLSQTKASGPYRLRFATMVTTRAGTRTHAPRQHAMQTRAMAREVRRSARISRPGLARFEFTDQLPRRRRRVVQTPAPVMPSEEVVVAAEPPAAEEVDARSPAAVAVAGASASAPEVSNFLRD